MKKKKKDISELQGEAAENIEENEENTASDSLSEDELRMLRASIEGAGVDRSKLPPHDTSDRAAFLRLLKKNKLMAACAAFVAVALVFGAVGGCFLIVSNIINANKDFTVYYNSKEFYTVSYKDAVIDDVLYIDIMKLADFVGMTVSGTESKRQLTSNNGTYLLFENNSERAYINGGITDITAKRYSNDKKSTSAPAYVTADECLVPYSFLEKAVDGTTLRCALDKKDRTIDLRPQYIVYKSDPDNEIMKDVLFITDNFDITLPETERPTYNYTYALDSKLLSEYMPYITAEHLMLANKTNALGADYIPSGLTKLECSTAPNRTFELQSDAANALYAMMLEMEAAGVTDVYVTSAYRSYEYQENLYERYIQEELENGAASRVEAAAIVATYSARPGESEHQTGLCLDFTTESMGGKLNENFQKTDAFAWLKVNAYKYGFILRYPADKVSETGYEYEPWHYRFVGRQAAAEMYHSGQSLEAYLGAV